MCYKPKAEVYPYGPCVDLFSYLATAAPSTQPGIALPTCINEPRHDCVTPLTFSALHLLLSPTLGVKALLNGGRLDFVRRHSAPDKSTRGRLDFPLWPEGQTISSSRLITPLGPHNRVFLCLAVSGEQPGLLPLLALAVLPLCAALVAELGTAATGFCGWKETMSASKKKKKNEVKHGRKKEVAMRVGGG